MARAYSLDLRVRAVAASARQPRAQVAALFQLSLVTLWRWRRRQRAGVSLAPKQAKPGFRGQFEEEQNLTALRAQVAAAPDARLADHCRRWQENRGRAVSVATMGRALARLGWTHKKSIS